MFNKNNADALKVALQTARISLMDSEQIAQSKRKTPTAFGQRKSDLQYKFFGGASCIAPGMTRQA
jgi:hypothetical protein